MSEAGFNEILKKAPKNWKRWGKDDEVGALNFLTASEVMRGIRSARQGKVFSLGLPIGLKTGDLVFPGRSTTIHLMTQDASTYDAGKVTPLPGE